MNFKDYFSKWFDDGGLGKVGFASFVLSSIALYFFAPAFATITTALSLPLQIAVTVASLFALSTTVFFALPALISGTYVLVDKISKMNHKNKSLNKGLEENKNIPSAESKKLVSQKDLRKADKIVDRQMKRHNKIYR